MPNFETFLLSPIRVCDLIGAGLGIGGVILLRKAFLRVEEIISRRFDKWLGGHDR